VSYEELIRLIRGRRSIRAFKPDAVPPEDVEKMLEAALWAPSGNNTQPWLFIAVTDREAIARAADLVRLEIERISRSAPGFTETGDRLIRWGTFFSGAPLVFFAAGRREKSFWRRRLAETTPGHPAAGESLSWLASCAAAIQNLLLAAHALGYGACWMGAPLVAKNPLEDLLELPEGYELLAVIPAGSPIGEPSPPLRRPREQTTRKINRGG
jgi:nitroreductase